MSLCVLEQSSVLRRNLGILRGNILVFSLTDMLGNFARGLVFPFASLYILALGGDAAKIGFASSLGLLAGFFVLPLAGYITDHADRVRLLVLSGFLASLFLVLMVLAPNWQMVAVASLLFGSIVFQFPAYASLIADSLAPADRGRGIGYMNTISSSLAIVAPFLAGLVIEKYSANLGMRILYAAMFAIYLLSTLIQARFLREPSASPREPLKLAALTRALEQSYASIPALLRQMSPPLQALAWVILLSFLANGVASSFWVVYATEEIGLSATEWGLILLVEAVVKLFAFMAAGVLVDRYGRKKILLVALLISLFTIPLFVILKSFMAIMLIRAATAVAFALAIPASTALMADLVPRRLRGKMMAAIGQGGMMIGPAGGGAGGPALGYLFIPPVMVASIAGGYLYLLNPIYPWVFSLATTVLSIILTVLYIKDAHSAEV
jgi:MFS family permease